MALREESFFADLEIRLAFNERQIERMQQVIDQLETRLTSSEGKLASLIGKLPGDLLNDDTEENSQ